MNNYLERFNAIPLGQRVLLLFLLIIVIVIGYYMLIYAPLTDAIAAQNAQLARLERQKQKLKQLKANKAEVMAKLEALNRQLLIAQEKLPVNAEVPSLLQRIHNQAKTAGLEIEKFVREDNKSQAYYIEIPVQMELVGTYDELANFFYYVGRMTRIVNVREIGLEKLRSSASQTDTGELRVKALATTFMYRSDVANQNKGPGAGPRRRPAPAKKK